MVARSRGPFYDISALVRDCSIPGRVQVRKTARTDAKFFGFETKTRILDFLSSGDFEEFEHDSTDDLDCGVDKGAPFDAYIFKIGPKHVYFAFYKRPSGLWVIKSFHPPQFGDKAPQLSHTPFIILGGLKK